MNTLKRFAALFAVVMILAMTMAMPAFAETSGCGKIPDSNKEFTSEACDVAKAIGSGVEYNTTKDTANGYSYDVMVNIAGKSTQIWLKSRPEVDNFKVNMSEDGGLDVMGIGTGDSNQWNNLFGKYRTVVVGVSGVGAITMIVFFILNFMKLGSSAGNPQARSQALTGVLWTGLAAAGLGAVSIIAGFFYNAL